MRYREFSITQITYCVLLNNIFNRSNYNNDKLFDRRS